MTDLKEYARLADKLTKWSQKDVILARDALRFRANASEEVIAEAIYDSQPITDEAYFARESTIKQRPFRTAARAVIAALEGRKE